MRSEQETNEAIERYGDTVRRLCMLHLKHEADAQDVFQTVFLKYLLPPADFESREHEKAWFIRATTNACRDVLKSVFRRRTVSLESAAELPAQLTDENREVLRAVRALPPKYREVVYLHYYEGYTAPEIANILRKNVNTIYTNLTRAREQHKTMLGGEEDG